MDETPHANGTHTDVTRKADLGDLTDGADHDRTFDVVTDENDTLISAEKVIGTPVYNGSGERLGSIDSLMLNKRTGRVAYAVMSFGGVLGIGERYHPLPWARLTFDDDRSVYNIDLTPAELVDAPHFTREDLERIDASAHGTALRDYYGTTSW